VSMSDLFKRQKCKALTVKGKPCLHNASIGGYCVVHYNMMLGKIPVKCVKCPDKLFCELLKRGDTFGCKKN